MPAETLRDDVAHRREDLLGRGVVAGVGRHVRPGDVAVGPDTSEPPSCAAFPTVRVWILRLRAPARRPFETLVGPNSSVTLAIFAPAAR